ncbi:uncharacterized protein LOC135579466 [Columba livia]|uniref:uncharacterized protein LOC135579466 n=1 Tax=Columba livia TaxID=8932 RepID=UPI0031B9D592
MWEAMFSVPQTLHNVLRELHIQLQDRRYRVLSTPLEDISILRLALLASSDLEEEEFAPMYLAGRFLRQRRPAMLSLVLSGIMTLSEKEEMARKMLVLLPDLRRVLFFGYKAVTMKALVVFRHLMAQLEREKASPIAVQLAEFVLPFFDDELSQMRESSISLFRDLMKMVVENHKRQMKSIAQASLLPLFFHMSDQVRSVAKVQTAKLSSVARKRRPGIWARACPRSLMAESPQEQSPEEGDARCPSPDRGATSQLLLFCRPPRKPSLPQQSCSRGNSSNTWHRHSRRGGLESICPPAPGDGQRTLPLLPSSSDHCDPELFEEAAKITMELASPVLLAQLNQAEEQLFLGKTARF